MSDASSMKTELTVEGMVELAPDIIRLGETNCYWGEDRMVRNLKYRLFKS